MLEDSLMFLKVKTMEASLPSHILLWISHLLSIAYTDPNIALNKPAFQSAVYKGGHPSRAVDGNTSPEWSDGTCTHTQNSPGSTNPWWTVDLGTVYSVYYVRVFNRNLANERLHDFNVGVTNTTPVLESPNPSPRNYDLCGVYSGVVYKRSVDIICNMDTRGRYVIIQIPGALEILTLCEVQVFEGNAVSSTNGLCSRKGIPQPGKRFTGHTIAVHAVINRIRCIALCAQTSGCGSVNVCDNKAQHCRRGDGKIECELNNDCLPYFPDIDVAEEWSFVPLKGVPCI